jgi:hypothetical protein
VGFITEDTRENQEKLIRYVKGNKFTIPEDQDEFYDLFRNMFYIDTTKDISALCGSDDGINDGQMLIGKALADVSSEDGYIEAMEIDIDDHIIDIQKIQKSTGLGGKVKVIVGQRAS